MRLGIIVNKQHLVIPEDAIPNLQQMSPLYDFTGVPPKWLLPISISYRENANILGLPANPAVIDSEIEYACQLILLNSWVIDGILLVTKADEDNIQISIVCPYYDLSETLFNTKIRDLDWDDKLLVEPEPQIYIDITFTLIGSPGVDTLTVGTGFDEYVHDTDGFEGTPAIIGAFIDAINLDTDVSGISASSIGSNVLRLKQAELGTHNNVFKTELVFATSGTYSISYDFMTWLTDWHDDCKVALDAYAESGDIYPDLDIVFPNIYNPNHFGDLNPDFYGWINRYQFNQYFINYTSLQAFSGNKWGVMPFVFAITVIKKIFDTAGITIDGPGVTEERFRRILIDNNYTIGKEWFDPVGDNTILVVNDRIKIANHLPDMTVGEFLTGYRNKFNLYFHYDPLLRIIYFRKRDDVIANPILNNFNGKPYAIKPVYEFGAIDGVKISNPKDTTDDANNSYFTAYNTDLLQNSDYIIGNGKYEINSVFGCPSVSLAYIFDGNGIKLKVPYKLQLGSGNEFEVRFNEPAPGFLIYKGLVEDENGEDYCFATNDHLDQFDEDDASNISLQNDKLYELFFTKWCTFILNSASMRVTLALRVTDIIDFKFDEFYGMQMAHWISENWQIIDIIGDMVYIEFIFNRRKNYF